MKGQTRSIRLALPLFAWLIASCGSESPSANPGASTTAGPAREAKELTSREVDTVTRDTLMSVLPISGSLSPLNETLIKSKVGAEVLAVLVREGQQVSAGDELVRLDTRTLSAQHDSAKASLDRARAELDIAQLNFENSERLFQRGVLPKTDLDTKKGLFDAARATVKLSEAQLRMAAIALDDTTVRAPFDGIVSRRLVDPGGKVSPDAPLVELVDLEKMEFQASAPAIEMRDVRVGQHAEVNVDGYSNEVFDAVLERISPVAEKGSRLVLLYLAMDNADSRLRGGMFAQGKLVLERREQVLSVPSAAVRHDQASTFVLVIADGVLTRREVTLGLVSREPDRIEVTSGLQEGEVVLAVRFSALEPGTPVRIVGAG